jgi:copper(I)-binding protein
MSHLRLGRRVIVIALLAEIAASATPRPIVVANAWTRPAMMGMNAAGYLTIANRGPVPDRLDSASSPVAVRVTLHESRITRNVSIMRSVTSLPVAPHGRVTLSPGGFHLMLEGLKKPLKPGERAPMTLVFQRAGPVRVSLSVRGGAAPMLGMKM